MRTQSDSRGYSLFSFLKVELWIQLTMTSTISVTLNKKLSLSDVLASHLWIEDIAGKTELGHPFRWLALWQDLWKDSVTMSVCSPTPTYHSLFSRVSHTNVPEVFEFHCLIKVCKGRDRLTFQPAASALEKFLAETHSQAVQLSSQKGDSSNRIFLPARVSLWDHCTSQLTWCWWVMCDNCLLLLCFLRRWYAVRDLLPNAGVCRELKTAATWACSWILSCQRPLLQRTQNEAHLGP